MGALRSYVSVRGNIPFMLLEWPASLELPALGSAVSVRLLPPAQGTALASEGLAAVFASSEVKGMTVLSLEGEAAREYSNVLHHNAPSRDARAVKLRIPAECIRTAPSKGATEASSKASRKKGGGTGGGTKAGLLRNVERLVPVPDVARGPVELVSPKPPRRGDREKRSGPESGAREKRSGTEAGSWSSERSEGAAASGAKGLYRPRITRRQWTYVLVGMGSAVLLAGAAAAWFGRGKSSFATLGAPTSSFATLGAPTSSLAAARLGAATKERAGAPVPTTRT